MTWLSDSTPLIASSWLSSKYAGHGVLGVNAPSTGLNGPGLFAGVAHPAEDADEFRALILTQPGGLTFLDINEDGQIEAEGPAGTYAGTWRGYKNGVAYTPDPSTYTIVIGAGLSGGATLDDVAASGGLGVAGASGLSGGATLDTVAASGGLGAAGASALSGGATLEDVSAAGALAGGGPIRPPVETGYYPRLRRTVRLAVADPREVPDLSPMAPGDTVTLEFDFRPWVAVAAPTVTVARIGGDDGLPGLQLVGQAVVVQGSYVLQRFNADLTALHSVYQVACQVTTDDTGRVTATGRLPVRIC